jgi:hypothetical protein
MRALRLGSEPSSNFYLPGTNAASRTVSSRIAAAAARGCARPRTAYAQPHRFHPLDGHHRSTSVCLRFCSGRPLPCGTTARRKHLESKSRMLTARHCRRGALQLLVLTVRLEQYLSLDPTDEIYDGYDTKVPLRRSLLHHVALRSHMLL